MKGDLTFLCSFFMSFPRIQLLRRGGAAADASAIHIRAPARSGGITFYPSCAMYPPKGLLSLVDQSLLMEDLLFLAPVSKGE